MDENIFGFALDEPLTKEKTKSIRVSDWTYDELTELREITGVTYGNLVKQAIPLLQKKYKIKKEVK
jgi:hypothetical protein